MRDAELLSLAIADNVAWCHRVAAAHGGTAVTTPSLWLNLRPSPRFYPNLVTRRLGLRDDIVAATARLRASGVPAGWGLKDSFADLDLAASGFAPLVQGQWYGLVAPDMAAPMPPGWRRVVDAAGLAAWARAWGGDDAARTFPERLLAGDDVQFWGYREDGALTAGFVAHQRDASIGLSNWFSSTEPALAPVCDVAQARWPGRAFVFWATDGDDVAPGRRLGPLRVWLAQP